MRCPRVYNLCNSRLRRGERTECVIVVPLRVELSVWPEGAKQLGRFDIVNDGWPCITRERVEIVYTKVQGASISAKCLVKAEMRSSPVA